VAVFVLAGWAFGLIFYCVCFGGFSLLLSVLATLFWALLVLPTFSLLLINKSLLILKKNYEFGFNCFVSGDVKLICASQGHVITDILNDWISTYLSAKVTQKMNNVLLFLTGCKVDAERRRCVSSVLINTV
jgi:ABC-type transport system involved in multi-copper enzyme maturation permease subunit